MSLNKVNYINNQTIIGADNLNAIQDEIIAIQQQISNFKLNPNVRNILDNSDFTNPVNQRGQTSYSSRDTDYGIDRWFGGNDGIVTVENGYVNFKSVNNAQAFWLQFIESNKIENGKKYTLVCELLNGSIFSKIVTASINKVDTTDIGQNSIIYLGNDSNVSSLYFVGIGTTLINGVNIKNIALYEGEYTTNILPEYQPKGYSVELLECKRYFEKLEVFSPLSVPDYEQEYVSIGISYAEKRIPNCTYTIELIWCPGWYGPEQLGTITFENSSERSIQINVSNTDAAGKIAQVKIFISADL